MFKIPHLRWLIAFALCLAAVLNYLDRSVLGLLAPTIQKDLGITDQAYASVINCFLVAYTLAYLLSGRIVDRLGVRLSMVLFIAWWSVSNALTGLTHSARSLSVYRFMLGLGEAGSFTASPKAVSEWFPPAERGIAIGIYSVGGALGATIAPILVTIIAGHFGWRWVFAVSPILAGIWLVFWLWLYRKPLEHPRITDRERAYLAATIEPADTEKEALPTSEQHRWLKVFRLRYVWQLMVARLLTDPAWYFFQFRLPKYLHTVRGLDQAGLAITWRIFLAADIGFLLGGYLAGRLVKTGLKPAASRLRIMLISAGIAPLAFCVPLLTSTTEVICVCMLVACALTAWLSNLTSLVLDLTPRPILGTAFGVIACGSAVGGILMNQGVAWLVTYHSYSECFYLMALLHPFAFFLIRSLGKQGAVSSNESKEQRASQ